MDGNTAVVTGGTTGLGRAVAGEFVAAGAHVVLCSREADEVAATVEALSEKGSASGLRADVRDEYDVERLLEHAARHGDIDVVVANAAVNHGDTGEMPLHAEPYSRFDETMRTNVRGVFATVTEAVPHLAEGARILVPTCAVARETTPEMGAYAVSKAGAEALVRGFDADLGADATAFALDPGSVATGLSGVENGWDPEEVASMFRWAATEADPAEYGGGVIDLKDWKTTAE